MSSEDQQFFVSFGLVVSARLGDLSRIREAIERLGGKIAFQTVSSGPLYVLRHYEVERIIQGDIDRLVEVHNRKSKERERRSEK